jgi:hypothetical protein
MTNEDLTWTQEELRNTLSAVEILNYYKGDSPALIATTNRLIDEMGLQGILAGYNNMCAVLVHQIALLAKRDELEVIYNVEALAKKLKIVG